ncbi:MAG: HU family DNA-binding protein [Planctomycetes bacterium]|jgi:DNA-binding protein HU-beta|nr:HU family DNA-binding protein [Planctomycetota bacterium]HJW87751.1 HU family DNA-binding protein [Candidatus Brocadiaceae bacterium]
MNKQELIEAVAKECEISKACGEQAVNAVLTGIKNGVKKNKEVRLIGFGTFSVRSRKARKGRNPQTGATINIKASKTVKFTAGQDFKGLVNK